MQRRLLIALLSFVAVVFASAVPAAAGGWAVTTLDEVPAPSAGGVVAVGFTIRQHGVTPVNPEGQVGIEVHSASGGMAYFPAVPAGPVGHYVSQVTFTEAGTVDWVVRQGWFEAQDLGPLTVSPAGNGSSSAATGEHYEWSSTVRFALPALAIALGVFAVLDARRSRRRPSSVVA
jgi:hypothetical protein